MPVKTTSRRKHLNLTPYMGKWVAILDEKVVESDKIFEFMMARIRRRKFKRQPSVMLVPRKDEGPYILIACL